MVAYVPTRIVLLNPIAHMNTVNRIVCNWTITSFKSCHSLDFRKPGCGEKTIRFDPYCPFKVLISFSSNVRFCVLFQRFKNILNQCYYGLTQNVFLEYQFLSKAHLIWCTYCSTKSLPSSNQHTIRLELYCPLKALFFCFKISLANINYRQYDWPILSV